MGMGGGSSSTSKKNENLTPQQLARLFVLKCLSAAIATSTAEVVTIPIDTAKVRLQIQGQMTFPKGYVPYKGLSNTLLRIGKEEGLRGLFKGASAGVMRQCFYGTTRLALYEPVRNFYIKQADRVFGDGNSNNSNSDSSSPFESSFAIKVIAGLTTGAIGICVGQPADVIKIRFQAEGRLPPGVEPRYKNLRTAIRTIPREDGITGLWRGLGPNILRNSVINAAELATYDQIKHAILSSGLMDDSYLCHFTSGFMAGFCAVIVGSPVDVVKTRIMNKPVDKQGKLLYRSAPQAFGKILAQEGPLAFYKGFVPNFMRIGTWNIVMFLAYEQVKKVLL